ncbi:DUF305 domain-containing protein [Pilimelia columellifera]|uniref:DUF305 domain-containing protein n=1 Tax=Pilimelia columellifera subsp. columellifera TaxID=706583 RepID=A0ABN3NHC4_9ACTN
MTTTPPAETGRTPRFGVAALAAAIVIGLILGGAIGWLVPKIGAPTDNSVEAGFARDMTNHHAQAVEMGLIGFRRGEDALVRQYAVDIATGQQAEIGMMGAWLREWDLPLTSTDPAMAWIPHDDRKNLHQLNDGMMPGMASAEEMTRLRAATGRQLDVLFLQLMIRHHLGGVHMIEAVIKHGDDKEVLRSARTMRSVQDAEVKNLTAALTRLGGTPLPAN